MVRMAAGELHSWSWLARGWMVRSCLVVCWYALRAFSKMPLNLEDDAVVGGVLDIELESRLEASESLD